VTTPPSLATVLANPAAHALATTFEDGDDRRRPVLEAAARLLAEEGPHGLSLRRIAAEAGGSTQLVYTLFGGKSGLADALYAEGFGRLAAACRAALVVSPPPGDPERLMAIGRAYRAFAMAEPAFFAVMFGKAIPDFTPTTATSGRCRANTFGNLVAEVQACLDAGTLVATSAEELARLCWVTVHGLSALESAGMLRLDDPDAFVEEALRTPLLAHRP
jgi:AcrR family transcriptional regulator